jgi:hypothetical protein
VNKTLNYNTLFQMMKNQINHSGLSDALGRHRQLIRSRPPQGAEESPAEVDPKAKSISKNDKTIHH